MNEIIKRNSEIYTRIEKLKPYEFIHSVVYELQMRKQNTENKIVYNKTKGYLLYYISINEIRITDKINLRDLIFNIFPSLYANTKDFIKKANPDISDEKIIESIKKANFGIKEIIENYIKNENEKFNEVFYEHNNKMEKLTKEKLIEIIDKTSFAPILFPDFSVPPVYEKHHKNVTLMNINLELPEKDLIDYIKKIKKDYDTNKLRIEMPVDLINDNYKENNELCTQKEYYKKKFKMVKVKKKDGKIIVKSSQIIFNSPKKVADMLFIYDQTKKGLIKKEIKDLLTEYYKKEFTYNTYDFYKVVAEEFIDNNEYIKLVSNPL